ncbi:hypothetical protein QBC41DRAFT_122369 [Cercophora samala]|uniref:Secreted protein n=1 Tax=Cercophora samala TaxID=330535 RepID=A0AA40DC28_9PEZI|nr:hypothetical protein QBC41DRAFT_122369 [Cercophora samala]
MPVSCSVWWSVVVAVLASPATSVEPSQARKGCRREARHGPTPHRTLVMEEANPSTAILRGETRHPSRQWLGDTRISVSEDREQEADGRA